MKEKGRCLLKPTVMILALFAVFMLRGTYCKAAKIYDDPVRFYNEREESQEGEEDDGWVYFVSRGKTADNPNGTLFRTVGYRIYLNTTGIPARDLTVAQKAKLPQMEVLLDGSYVKEYKQVKKTVDGINYTYVVRRARANRLRTLFNKNMDAITPYALYNSKDNKEQNWAFDAVMTVVQGGRELCGSLTQTKDGEIKAENSNYLYRYLNDCAYGKGIADAQAWSSSARESLKSFFGWYVKTTPNLKLEKTVAYIDDTAGNVYNPGTGSGREYFVRKNSVINLSMTSIMGNNDIEAGVISPDFNTFFMKKVVREIPKNYYYSVSPGAEAYGTYTYPSSGCPGMTRLSSNGKMTFNNVNHYFNSDSNFTFGLADADTVEVATQASAYYKHKYPVALNMKEAFPSGSENTYKDCIAFNSEGGNNLKLISDGTAPQVSVPSKIGVDFHGKDIYVPFYINDIDSNSEDGSGIKRIRIYDSAGNVYYDRTISGYYTQVFSSNYNQSGVSFRNRWLVHPDDAWIERTDKNLTYYVEATDNVGNVSTSFFKVVEPVNYSVYVETGNDTNGFNSRILDVVVAGGSNGIRSVSAMSDDDENPSGERIIFINENRENGGIAENQRSFTTRVDPVEIIKSMVLNPKDGWYNIFINGGGMSTEAAEKSVQLKMDFHGPVINNGSELTTDSDTWVNYIPEDGFVDVGDLWSGVKDFTIYEVAAATASNPYGYGAAWSPEKKLYTKGTYSDYKYLRAVYDYSDKGIKEGSTMFRAVSYDYCGNRSMDNLYYNLDVTEPEINLGDKTSSDDKYYVQSPFLNDKKFYVTDLLSGLSGNANTIKVYKGDGVNETNRQVIETSVVKSLSRDHAVKIEFRIKDAVSSSGNTYTVVATDRAGNTATKKLTVYYDKIPPQLYMQKLDEPDKYPYDDGQVFRNDMIRFIKNDKGKVESDTIGTNLDWTDDYAWWYKSGWWGLMMACDDTGDELEECYVECIDTGKKLDLRKYGNRTTSQSYCCKYYSVDGTQYALDANLDSIIKKEDGKYKCRLYAKDRAGNAVYYYFEIRRDNTIPEFTYKSTSGAGKNGWNASIPGTAMISDATSGIKHYEIWGDGKRIFNSKEDIRKKSVYHTLPGQYDSYKDLKFVVIDYAGNRGEYQVRKSDTSKPLCTVTDNHPVQIEMQHDGGGYTGTDYVNANPSSIDFVFMDKISGLAYCEVSIEDAVNIENLEKFNIDAETKWSSGNQLNNSAIPFKAAGENETINIDTSSWDRVCIKFRTYCVDVAGNENTGYHYGFFSRQDPAYEFKYINTTGEGKWNPEKVEVSVKADYFGLSKIRLKPSYDENETVYTHIPFIGNSLDINDFLDDEHNKKTFYVDSLNAVENGSEISLTAEDYTSNRITEKIPVYIDHTLPYVADENVDIISGKKDDDTYEFTVSNCKDDISGVKEGYVKIFDTDDTSVSQDYVMDIQTDDTGLANLSIEIKESDLPYPSDSWKFEVHVKDAAGNDKLFDSKYITDFDDELSLSVAVRRRFNYSEEKFKKSFTKGEMGYVDFTVCGKADRIVIDFPDNLDVQYDTTKRDDGERMDGEIIIDNPKNVYSSSAEGTSHEFFVPVTLKNVGPHGDDSQPGKYIADYLLAQDTPFKTYDVTVTAYRTRHGVTESVTATDSFSIKRFGLRSCIYAAPVYPFLFDVMGWNSTQDMFDYWNNNPRNNRMRLR